MIYQIYYDDKIVYSTKECNPNIQKFGIHHAKLLPRLENCLYDDDKSPHLTDHNTLCEWRVLYYIWKHYRSRWVGFTSWQHDQKGFCPNINMIDGKWIDDVLKGTPIAGFMVSPLSALMYKYCGVSNQPTVKNQFLQWSKVEIDTGKIIYDSRGMYLGCYHSVAYWDFVITAYNNLYGVDLETELDWVGLGKIDRLHIWCNAFIVRWDYFDEYMKMFSPIVLDMIEYFGSHIVDLELSYICERLIIIYNYIRYANNDFK